MNTYKLNIKTAGDRGTGLGCVRVQAADKASAPAEAIKAKVRHAKEYNAKYDGQGLPTWALKSENPADYEVWGTIRKVPAKKVTA